VVLEVDQKKRRSNVRLPNGMSAENHRVQIAAVWKPLLRRFRAEKRRREKFGATTI